MPGIRLRLVPCSGDAAWPSYPRFLLRVSYDTGQEREVRWSRAAELH
jgi:hypothetical protein